jgi:ABC-type uncharacterized transport system permease subunit
MNLITYSLLPALLLLIYGGLLAIWLQLMAKSDHQLEKVANRIGLYALGMYIIWIALISLQQDQIPVLSVGQLIAFLGFLIWADQTYVQHKVRQYLLVILPLCTVILLLLLGIVLGFQPDFAISSIKGSWSAFHITLSLAGVAMLLGSGVYGAGSMILHYRITKKEFGPLFSSLPSLSDMNHLRTIALYVGWLLITISLSSAICWMIFENSGTPTFFTHLHIMFALWLIVSLLALSERFNWLGQHRQSRLSVILSILIFVLVMASVVEMFSGGKA